MKTLYHDQCIHGRLRCIHRARYDGYIVVYDGYVSHGTKTSYEGYIALNSNTSLRFVKRRFVKYIALLRLVVKKAHRLSFILYANISHNYGLNVILRNWPTDLMNKSTISVRLDVTNQHIAFTLQLKFVEAFEHFMKDLVSFKYCCCCCCCYCCLVWKINILRLLFS